MRDKAAETSIEPRERAAWQVREALGLLEELGEVVPAFHLGSALALLEGSCPRANTAVGRRDEAPGDAIARAIGALMAIIERTTKCDRRPCIDSLAQAMEDHGKGLARRDMGTALLLDRWAGIIREQGVLLEPAHRQHN
ncbi:hypothetical protein [Aquamicrobium sp.]|uniref:hypothetical protein n=1 Tax=Aquamicrobium sp. TaxID=1872579 RepID=UPI002583C3CD|nr:hypothetical protein [Aquamicrobium sp.]MCK9549505.1 hypothetical protein [Aquamicrobium sp.]